MVFSNSLLILEFNGSSEPVAASLNKKYPVYLQCGTEKVPLLVVETLVGQFRSTQVVLRVSATLQPGKKYTLIIRNLRTPDGKPEAYNPATKKWEPYLFTSISYDGKEKPSFITAPVETKKTLVYYGCGPAKWVYYKQQCSYESQVYVKTYVKDNTTGQTTAYILAAENGEVKVGHGMCRGSFEFSAGHTYEVSFALLDQAGNSGDKTTAIPLVPPASATEDE